MCQQWCRVSPNLSGDERRIAHELEIEQVLFDHEVELVILSGYMRLLSPQFVEDGKVRSSTYTLHYCRISPAPTLTETLLHQGGEIRLHRHYVDAGMDTGQIIAQCEVEVLPEDTEETLASRIKHLSTFCILWLSMLLRVEIFQICR